MSPFSSGRTQSGNVIPTLILLMLLLLSGRADARDLEADAVDARERRDVQRAAVVVAPGQVVRRLGEAQRAEVLAGGGQDPDAAGAADVEIAVAVDLEPVDGVLAGRAGHVEEDRA